MFRHSAGFSALLLVAALATPVTAQVRPAARVIPGGPGLDTSVVKTVSDLNGGTVLPGDTLVYQVAMSNPGPNEARFVMFTDTLPANAAYVPGSLRILTGANAGTLTDASGDDQGTYESASRRLRVNLGTGATAAAGGTLGIGASTSLQFRVVVNAGLASGTQVANLAWVLYDDLGLDFLAPSQPPGGIPGDPTVIPVEIPDLTIAKSHTGNFVRGTTATYAVTVTNNGPGTTAGTITMTDVVPAGLTPTGASGSGWSCGVVGQTVTCTTTAALVSGAVAPVITVTVSVAASAAGALTNTATIAGGGETNTTNNTATDATTIVDPAIDLAIAKTHTGTLVAFQQGTFTLTVTNQTVATGAGPITVTDTLPAGLTFVSGTGTGWSCGAAGAVVTCTNAGPIAPSASTAITLTVNVGAAALPSVTNRAWVDHPGDAVAANNLATDVAAVTATTDLALTKTATSTFTVGQQATYLLTVANVSANPTTGATTIVDILPAGLTWVSGTGTGWSCAAVGQTVTCIHAGVLNAGASSAVTLTVAVGPAAAPSVVNTATVATSGDNNPGNDSGSATTPVIAPALDVSITKTLTTTLVAGQNATYALTVANLSGFPTTGTTTVTDVLPAGLSFVSFGGSGATCGIAGQTITCTRTSVLAASQSFTVTVTVAVAAGTSGTVSNTASVSTPGDVNPANDASTATATAASGIDLAISKTAGALTVGSPGTFTLVVSNVGANPTTGAITVTDNLPTGLAYVSGSGSGFTCSAAGQLVTCTRAASLAPGQSATITLTVNVGAAALPSIVNTATVATPGDAVPGNNTSTTTAPVVPLTPDVAITKSVIGTPVAGGQATFRMTVRNVGGAPTQGTTTVTDALQAGLTYVSFSGTGWNCSAVGQVVTCQYAGVLAPGAMTSFDLVVAVASSVTSLTNTAVVSSPGDGNGGNDTGTTSPTNTAAPPDLALTKTASGPFVVGVPASYTLTIRNLGTGPTTGSITVTDQVPAGLTVTAAQGAGWTCTISGQLVQCAHPGPLAPGGTLTITVSVTPLAAAAPSVTNTARVTTPGDAGPGNDEGSTTTPVSGSIDLSLTKQGADTLTIGAPTTWSLTVRNVGTLATSAPIVVTDTLPAGLTFVSASGPGFTCTAAGQVVTCTRNAPPLAPGASVAVDLTAQVTQDVAASVRNVACVRTGGDTNTANDCGARTSTTAGNVDLVAFKDATSAFRVGNTATFSLVVRNLGTAPALPPITIVDTLPAGLTFVSATGPGWSCSAAGNVVTCVRTTALPPGASPPVTLTVNVTAAALPRVVNCMHVRGTNETGSLGNNRSCAEPPVEGTGRLEVEKVVSRSEVQVGDVVDYTVTVRNVGTADITDAVVIDDLPPGFLLEVQSVRVNGVAGATVMGAPGPRITITVGRVPAGGRAVVTYRVRVGPGAPRGQAVNVAVASTATGGGPTAPARARVTVTGGVFDERGAIVGKVFIQCDCANNKKQDEGEVGIPGVRVYLEDGTSAVTDVEGKYNFYNVSSRLHVVKVDRTTLPAGAVLVPLANRNAGDAWTRFADVKAGELHRADFAEGSRLEGVLQQVIARRRAGEVNNAGEPATPVTAYRRLAAGQTVEPSTYVVGDSLRGAPLVVASSGAIRMRGDSATSFSSAMPLPPRGAEQAGTQRYAPLFRGAVLTENNSQLPVTPLRAQALQQGTNPSAGGLVEVRFEQVPADAAIPADGVTRLAVRVRALDAQGNPRAGRVPVTVEASLGRWLGSDLDRTAQGIQGVLTNGEGTFTLIAAAQPGIGEVRATTPEAATTVQVSFVPVARPMLVTGLVNARVDWQKLLKGGLGLSSGGDGFEEALRDWSTTSDSGSTRAGARAALLMKGTVLDDRLLTLSYDSERDRGRTFFRDISPNEYFPVYGDASLREFDAQSRRRFYARLDKGTGYTLFGDFQTTRADDRRMLTAYDRSLTGVVQHLEGRAGTATLYASQGRVSQQIDELPGRGISGPYTLRGDRGLINSERVELLVRDRNQPTVILSRTPMTRFADYTIEPVTGRLLFRNPVPSLDANLNPVSIRVTYEVEDGQREAFWVYGVDGALRLGNRVEVGGTFAKDEGPSSEHQLVGINATAKLGSGTMVMAEVARTEVAGTTGGAERVEVRHQSAELDARVFAVRSDAGFVNPSSVFQSSGARREFGGRFSRQLAAGTRLVGEALHSELVAYDQRRQGAMLSIEQQFTAALRGEFGYRYARANTVEDPFGSRPLGDDLDVNALRGRLQVTLPQPSRTSVFGEVEQDVRESDRRRVAVGGEYLIANRARLYGRHEFLSGLRDQFSPSGDRRDRNQTVFGIDADYFRNTQMFSEYRARDAFGGRDAEASIGLRNRWSVAPGLLLNTSFERVSPLVDGTDPSRQPHEALAVTGGLEWTRPALWKSTARLEYRDAAAGDNFLASFGYARKLSRDWTLLGRTLWDDYDAVQRQTRGFSQFGLAWRQTDRNTWNALARYEHRFERLAGGAGTFATRDEAHILAAMLNWQPVQRFTLSSRYAAKRSANRLNDIESSGAAQLLMARGVMDLTSRFDLGLISSTLFSDGLSDRKYGLGGELGVILMRNLRIAGGYNLFGFTDRDLNSFGTTRRGPYLELGFKFDEGLFGASGTTPPPANRDDDQS